MKRNKFSLSNTHLLSCDMGELVPVGLTEVLPGDTIQQSSLCMVRMAPLLSPVMHPVHVQLAHWFVPHRLVWTEWEDFITGGPDGNDASVFPTRTTAGYSAGQLGDYLGVPTGAATAHSMLPFRGYQLIWNEWYRDQDLQTEAAISKAGGNDATTSLSIQRVNWSKDYFTTARPWEQKGPTVTIPLGDTAPLELIGASAAASKFRRTSDEVALASLTGVGTDASTDALGSPGANVGYWDVTGSHQVDLSGASAVTVNVLREALAIQRFEEARARYGSRYTEYLRYLGVRSSDARLQRPEFLGGGRYPIQFSEVLQTAEGTDPVGTMAGHGIGVSKSNRFRRFFEEHGYIFTLMSIKPKAIYMDGLHRTWNRRAKEDFYQKELEHIGQQAIENREVYAASASPTDPFGYQDRYDEYRSGWSTVHGEFRTTLNFWHFARDFSSAPALNSTFVTLTPTEVPFAVPSTDVCYVMVKNSIQARRLLSKKGTSYIF